MKRARVLLADDHKILAEGVRRLLNGDFNVVGVVEDGRALVGAATELKPDVIVTDISMPLLDGIEATRRLKAAGLTAKVIILTMHEESAYVTRAFEAGASGYVSKHCAFSELIGAIRCVLSGRRYLTAEIAAGMGDTHRATGRKQADSKLTPRQREVLRLFAEGRSSKEIALRLHISSKTVEFHKYRLMKVLKIGSTAELTQYAIKHGIVSV